MRNVLLSTLTLTLVFFTGCSDSNPKNGTFTASTPEEALKGISQAHRNNFENWKNNVVKSCSASEAFDGPHDAGDPGVDISSLLQKTGRSAVLQEGSEAALVGAPQAINGVSRSSFGNTTTVNGNTYEIKAEAVREGFRCTLTLYGQKVYETNLAQSLAVFGHWSADSSQGATVSKLTPQESRTQGISIFSQNGFLEALQANIKPTQKVFGLLQSRLGISQAQASRAFRLSADRTVRFSAALVREGARLWFNWDDFRAILPTETAQSLLAGPSQTLDFESRIEIPRLRSIGIENDADVGTLALITHVETTKERAPGQYSFVARGSSDISRRQWNTDEASTCAVERLRILAQSDQDERHLAAVPSVHFTVSPCRVLTENLDDALYANGTFKKLLLRVLRDVQPSALTNYYGWDAVLSKYALEYLDAGKNLHTELNPEGTLRLISVLADYLDQLKLGLTQVTEAPPVKKLIYSMGVKWALYGQNVSANQSARILTAIHNTWQPFQFSTETFINELSQDPNGLEPMLLYSLALKPEEKAVAERAHLLATALDYSEWTDFYFNRAIQTQVSPAAFARWAEQLGTIQTELAVYPVLSKIRGLLTHATVQWIHNGDVPSNEFRHIYAALANAIDPFEEAVTELAKDMARSYGPSRAAIEYAAALSSDYKKTARELKARGAQLGMEDWVKGKFQAALKDRTPIEKLSRWNDLFTASVGFTDRERERVRGDSFNWNEDYRKDIIKKALEEDWSGSDLLTLEQIAELGKARVSCERHKGLSSVVNCIGLSNFSNKPKQFLNSTFEGRYGRLAQEFRGHLDRLRSDDYYTMRGRLVGAYFGTFNIIWVNCSQAEFETKAASLRTQIPAYVSESDTFKKWDREREIQKTLEDCR